MTKHNLLLLLCRIVALYRAIAAYSHRTIPPTICWSVCLSVCPSSSVQLSSVQRFLEWPK